MTTEIIDIKRQRAALVNEARQLLDRAEAEGRDFAADEQEQYDRYFADVEKLGQRIANIEKLENEERGGYLETGEDTTEVSDDMAVRSFHAALVAEAGGRSLTADERRAIEVTSDKAGGYLAPKQVVDQVWQDVDDMTFVLDLATIFDTDGTDSLGVPTIENDPADADWNTEIGAISEDSTMDFGERELRPHDLDKLVKVSRRFLQKVNNGGQIVQNRLAYKFAITMEKAFLTGTGAGQPLGVFTADSNGISTSRDVATGNSTTAIAADNLREVKYSLKAPYRANACWIFHRDGIKSVSKLKSGDGQYLWTPGVRQNDPDLLLGSPVKESEYAPNTFTTGLYVGIYGDFSYYGIARSGNLTIDVLRELYANTKQIGYQGTAEVDGMPMFENAFARVTLA